MKQAWRSVLLAAIVLALALGGRGQEKSAVSGPAPWLRISLPLVPAEVLTEAIQAQEVALPTALKEAGKGVKVGIIDTFAGFSRLLGKELPPPSRVIYRSFTANPGASAHGTAVAEIIYDLAPGATLYLAEAQSMTEVAQAVDWLISQGVDIINMSLNAPFAPPSDGTGFDAVTVEKAAAHGILWVNSAGNYGDKHWRGPWRDADGDLLLDFAPGREANVMHVPLGASYMVVLRWDDRWPGACEDYDLVVSWVGPEGQRHSVTSSDVQDCNATSQPLEIVSGQAQALDGRLLISVRRHPRARPTTLELWVVGGVLEDVTPEGSVAPPADSAKALSVGAAPYYDLGHVHPYSSRGPGAQGAVKPDFVGPDVVSTATFGHNAFAGTSAAAPHVAGLAAIIKGLRPEWGPEQIRAALARWAEDMGPPGPDTAFGYGAIDLARAIERILEPPPPPAWAAVVPYDDQQVRVEWEEVPEATYYLLCIDLRADFKSPYASCRQMDAEATSLLVPVPADDLAAYYFRVQACDDAGCSAPVSAGGVVRRTEGGPQGWDFYLTAYNREDMTVAAVRNLRAAPATMRLYRGLVGAYPWFSLEVECRDVLPGGICQGTWPASSYASAVQSLAPWWDLSAALILLP